MTSGGPTMEAERPGGDDATADAARPHHGRRGLAITAITLTVVGAVFTGLCLLVLVACWQDDAAIDAHLGQATADVLSSSPSRTAVRFVTPDGTVNIPDTGVLYPQGLIAGERVRVEYDTQNPQLVRVAGRDYQLAFLPVGTAILIAWAVLAPTLWWLRRRRRSAVG